MNENLFMHYRLPGGSRAELHHLFQWHIPEYFNLCSDTVERQAKLHPERLALIEPERRRVTYAELANSASRLSSALQARGFDTGMIVAVWGEPGLELALAHLAVYRLGAILLPLSTLFGKDAVRYRLEHAGARVILVARQILEERESWIEDIVEHRYVLEDVLEWIEATLPQPAHPTRADDPALLIYTSGTTGKPKGALLAHRTLLGHLPGFYLYSNDPAWEAVYWSPAEWAWVGGLFDVVLPAWFYGFTVLAYRGRTFDPEYALWLIEQYGVTHSFLFPTALKILRATGKKPERHRLKSIHSGGEVLGAEMEAWSREVFGLPINEFYGQTEANLLIGNSFVRDPIKPGSMGPAYPGHRVVLMREDGSFAGVGEPGEIALALPDPVAFLGYWNNVEATQEKIKDGWLRTGDLAVRDEDGYFWYMSRADDVINTAGYRLGPHEIESAIMQDEAVSMAAVVGAPDAVRGEKIVAFICLKGSYDERSQDDLENIAHRLRMLVRETVGHHAYPREIIFADDLPLTPTGKLMRTKLKELAEGKGKIY